MFYKDLSMPLVLNIPVSWIVQGSEYTSGFEYARILNILGFRICQGYTGFRICLNNSWICLNMPYSVWICLNMPEYAGICVNMPGSTWMTLALHFPISPWTLGYLFKRLQETRGYSRREHEAVFLKKRNLIFSIAAGSISFVFCFRLNISSSKI